MPITASYTDSYVKGVLKMFLHKFPDDTNEKSSSDSQFTIDNTCIKFVGNTCVWYVNF